jgi:abortive infection bacteriophage resistance protein
MIKTEIIKLVKLDGTEIFCGAMSKSESKAVAKKYGYKVIRTGSYVKNFSGE